MSTKETALIISQIDALHYHHYTNNLAEALGVTKTDFGKKNWRPGIWKCHDAFALPTGVEFPQDTLYIIVLFDKFIGAHHFFAVSGSVLLEGTKTHLNLK